MFEKHKPSKSEPNRSQPEKDNFAAPVSATAGSAKAAVIGPKIHINGDISGDENLVIEGKVDGKINLNAHQLDIGQGGRVNADITAKVIKIAGEVRGDLSGSEKVVISRTGNVHGNIVAPRMTLEDGAIFKGSIDMDPGEPAKVKTASPAKQTIDNSADKAAEKPKAIGSEKAREHNSYSLNGG
jgi:cytoskeletal protein CcmA (bactofilin family)